MKFTFIPYQKEAHKEQWDAFVRENPHAWPGQHSAIIDFEQTRGNPSLAHLVFNENDQLAAVVPMFIRSCTRSRFFKFRSLCSGSTLRGGPLLRANYSAKVREQFMEAWHAWLLQLARREHLDEIRVAFPHVFGDQLNDAVYSYFPLRDHGFHELNNITILMDLKTAPQDLIGGFDPKCRNKIRRALAEGAEFTQITDRQTWMDCYAMNVENFQGQFTPYSREAMAIIWDDFVEPGAANIYAVRHEGRLVSVAVYAGTRHSCYNWIVFNRRPMNPTGAHNLLVYRSMELLRESGCHYFEIGSMEFDDPRQQSIARFKTLFGGRPRYSMDGQFMLSELKMATVNWLQALMHARRRRRTPLPAETEQD